MKNNNILFALLLIHLTACSSFNPFEDEGEYVEKRVEITGITAIENLNTFQIQLVQDDQEYIIFKGGENLVSKVKQSSTDEYLKIDHSYSNNARNFDLIIAEIHVKNLTKLKCSAPAKISNENQLNGKHLDIIIISESELVEMDLDLKYESMKFHSYGNATGGYEFSGTCNDTHYILNGVINIKASHLQTNNTHLRQNGIGEAHVWVNDFLKTTIYSSGNIYYKGNPEIEINRIQVNNQSPVAKVIPE